MDSMLQKAKVSLYPLLTWITKWSFIMYNSVTGTLYGVSKNCWNLYGIPKSLVYGNGDGEHSIVN